MGTGLFLGPTSFRPCILRFREMGVQSLVRTRPDPSRLGIVIAAFSIVAFGWLVDLKRNFWPDRRGTVILN